MPDTLAHRKIFGVLVPYFNSVVEPELASLRPDGVSNQTARFSLDADVLEQIAGAAERLATCGAEAFIVGLATESFAGGLELLQEGVDAISTRTGLPVFTATHATQAAVTAIGAKRVAIVTPFDAEGNANVRAFYDAAGFEVVAIHGLACASFDVIARSSSHDIRRAFERVDSTEVEALVQIGTGLPTLDLVTELEAKHDKPVVTCNAASYWQALRVSGIEDRLEGFGRLLADRVAVTRPRS
ncbi:MAG: arylmalonate decarboxylase [Candidatus Binatia bacterium]